MTKREFLEAIVNGNINEDIVSYAADSIVKLDASNAKRKEKNSEKKQATIDGATAMAETLTDEPKTATQLGEEFNVSTQRASAWMRKAVELGLAVKQDIKVKGKGTVKGYTKA